MTLDDITKRITFYTGATGGASGQFADADRLIAINKAYNDINILILQSEDEWDFDDKNRTLNFPILTTSLTAGQQDYTLPSTISGQASDISKLKRVEITYDGSNWYRANPLDINEYDKAVSETTNISGDFVTTAPYYDLQYNSIFLYPIPSADSSAGLKIWVNRSLTEFTSDDLGTNPTTTRPGFDRQFHDMVALKPSIDWLNVKTENFATADRLKREYQEMEVKLLNYYGSKQKDRNYMFKAEYIDYN